jgi:pilus assembly protein CpaB
MLRSQAAPVPTPPVVATTTRVLVAAGNLPAGTIIKPDNVRWQAWPEQGVDAAFILEGRDTEAATNVVTAAVKRGFVAGEPISLSRVARRGEAGFLAAALAPGMRAISVKIDAVSGTAGFIIPGDKVDVMLAGQLEVEKRGGKPEQKSFAEFVMSGIRVLAIDQSMKDIAGPDEKQQAKTATTATLEVTLNQAEAIGVASQVGKIVLVLAGLVPTDPDEPAPAPVAEFLDDTHVSKFFRAVKGLDKSADSSPTLRPLMTVYRGTAASTVGGQPQ